jgi:hypothetical protein
MFHNHPRILPPFIRSLLTIIFSLNCIMISFSSWIGSQGKLFFKADLRLTPRAQCILERQNQLCLICTVVASPHQQLQSPIMECIPHRQANNLWWAGGFCSCSICLSEYWEPFFHSFIDCKMPSPDASLVGEKIRNAQ